MAAPVLAALRILDLELEMQQWNVSVTNAS